ncbi:4'-phosphopantetheinyl transferase superfamily protein [Bacillus sp. WMMC1349]|uniref:4'-phosphopantetheinyl transferase family protein n=1 Tax=Bacillus sp. WMMC1349 TaxID=2736254 RepID=UPI0015574361|nr:4'-phosphopantetheinyl transferase superfamily protein [Bacillus sp. WMMC1349]NPC91481.1 4'-phosphopantetheinyl transferase superfamily protein [Bacillus sp. WMMC1349]
MKIYAVYLDQLPGPDQFERMMAIVSEEKRHKVKRYRYPEDANRTLIGEVLVRNIIKETYQLPNEAISFTAGPHGKPFAKGLPDFHFNISHSGSWVICGAGRSAVGVDVEKIKPINFDIAERFFSPAEYRDLMAKKETERLSYFYHLWTIKESFVKQAGKGLALPLDSFSVKLDGQCRVFVKAPQTYLPCYLKTFELDPDYKMAACSAADDLPDEVIKKRYDEL